MIYNYIEIFMIHFVVIFSRKEAYSNHRPHEAIKKYHTSQDQEVVQKLKKSTVLKYFEN